MARVINLFPPKLWFFLFSLIFFGVSLFLLPWAGASADEKIVEKYDRDHGTLQEAVIQYHTTMNELFNKSLKLMLSGKGDLKPPADEVCPENNVSTYCVAARAVQEYEGFRIALKTHTQYISDKLSEEQTTQYISTEQALSVLNQRHDLVNSQLDIAKKVLDVTLATYNEAQVLYPLHKEYGQLIKDLEKYRDALAGFRKEVELYPRTFHNVMTTQCT